MTHLFAGDVAHLYLEMAKTQLPEFEYKFISEHIPTLVDCIGYGCFS